MPISSEKESKILYSLRIRDWFESDLERDFLSLFPTIAKEAAAIRRNILCAKVNNSTEILPGEVDLNEVKRGTFFELGKMYYFGEGRDKDVLKAIFYFHV